MMLLAFFADIYVFCFFFFAAAAIRHAMLFRYASAEALCYALMAPHFTPCYALRVTLRYAD